MNNAHSQFDRYKQRVEDLLAKNLPQSADVLHQAMRYSVLNGGKRLRALLVYASGQVAQAPMILLDNAAMVIEYIHAYSLIHDDLPAMDDDDLRRGKPTCHKVYGEATAILAGDALQSLAFEILARNKNIEQIQLLATAIGANGMVLGQSLDMHAELPHMQLSDLEKIHALKTGALIATSMQLGASCGSLSNDSFQFITQLGNDLGLAFQIQDDILDVEGKTEMLGKKSGTDQQQHKTTYVSLLGLQNAKQKLSKLNQNILSCLNKMPDSQLMREIIGFIVERQY